MLKNARLKSFLFGNTLSNLAYFSGRWIFSYSLARNMSIGEFGLLAFILSLANILAAIISFGAQTFLIYKISRYELRKYYYLKRSVLLSFVIVIVLFGFILAGKYLIEFDFSSYYYALLLAVILSLSNTVYCFFRGVGLFANAAVGYSVFISLIGIFSFYLYLSNLPTNLENMFWWCITINLMLLMTALVQLFYYSKKDNDERTFPDRPKSLFRFFRDRIPYGLHELQSALYMNAIILVLGFIVTNDQLATYRALQLIFVPIGIVPIIMSQVLLKVLSERVAESQFVVKTFNRFLIVSVVISVCFILLLVSYGKQLIGLMYSNEYQDSPFLLELIVVFSVSHLFRFVSANYGVLITAYGKQRIRAYATFLLVLTTVVGCILFVDRYGLVGAAYASALSYLCLMVVYSGYAEIFLLKRNNLC